MVQDPEEADYPGMPRSAIASVDVDHVLPIAEIAALLATLAHQEVEEPELPPEEDAMEIKKELERGEDREGKGPPSSFTCPECGGTLFEREKAEVVHFRCRTGHAYSPESLLAKQSESLEATLWAALRALEENAALARRMERWMLQRGRPGTASRSATPSGPKRPSSTPACCAACCWKSRKRSGDGKNRPAGSKNRR